MTQEFVPYEPSLALKELGFDEPCLAFWDVYNGGTHLLFKQRIEYHWLLRLFGKKPEPVLEISNGEIEYLEGDGAILAPTFSQAFRWLLKNHNLYGIIIPTITMNWTFKTMTVVEDIMEVPPYKHVDANDFNTYEEAELDCLIKLIQIVKEKKNG